jgi:hypothetical protein
VTAWISSEVGPVKRFSKKELDKKCARPKEQSPRELQAAYFPQASTGARFRTVLAAESFVPKFERSETREREHDAEKKKDRSTQEETG